MTAVFENRNRSTNNFPEIEIRKIDYILLVNIYSNELKFTFDNWSSGFIKLFTGIMWLIDNFTKFAVKHVEFANALMYETKMHKKSYSEVLKFSRIWAISWDYGTFRSP